MCGIHTSAIRCPCVASCPDPSQCIRGLSKARPRPLNKFPKKIRLPTLLAPSVVIMTPDAAMEAKSMRCYNMVYGRFTQILSQTVRVGVSRPEVVCGGKRAKLDLPGTAWLARVPRRRRVQTSLRSPGWCAAASGARARCACLVRASARRRCAWCARGW